MTVILWVLVGLLVAIAIGIWAVWDELCATHRATHQMRLEVVAALNHLAQAEKSATSSITDLTEARKNAS